MEFGSTLLHNPANAVPTSKFRKRVGLGSEEGEREKRSSEGSSAILTDAAVGLRGILGGGNKYTYNYPKERCGGKGGRLEREGGAEYKQERR